MVSLCACLRNRRDEPRHDRPPMLRPPPGRDWPPRGPLRGPPSPKRLLPPERPQPPADLNQVNVNKLLSDLLSMGIIPGQGKTNDTEKPAEAPVDTKSSQEVSEVHQTDPVIVPSLPKVCKANLHICHTVFLIVFISE